MKCSILHRFIWVFTVHSSACLAGFQYAKGIKREIYLLKNVSFLFDDDRVCGILHDLIRACIPDALTFNFAVPFKRSLKVEFFY